MANVRYETLGSLRFRTGSRLSTVNARNMEVILATLLVRADETVSVPQLAYEVWGNDPPRRYLAAIHVYISQLRKMLAEPDRAENPIVTRSPGYVLRLGADRVDAEEFQRLTQSGREATRAGRLEEAAGLFEEALALWRGPALGDLRAGPIVDGFTTWAEEARLECVCAHVDAGLALGRHRELIGGLYSLVAEHPLHEGFHRQLMIALYRSERQSDALRVYRAARRTLSTELGIEPGRALREVHRAILLADQRLDLAGAGARHEPARRDEAAPRQASRRDAAA
jgi:DNA-binding SARP family transcriptional activator